MTNLSALQHAAGGSSEARLAGLQRHVAGEMHLHWINRDELNGPIGALFIDLSLRIIECLRTCVRDKSFWVSSS